VDRFIEQSHIVCGCGRSESLVTDLNSRFFSPSRFDCLDISNWEQVNHWADRLIKDGFLPDLLINNAAVINNTAPLWQISDDEFRKVMDINVAGTANTIRAFLPAMIEKGDGIIVNMSSAWGRSTAPNVAPYCTSKWAIEGMTQAMSQELPQGIAAIAVNPGVIDTDMLRKSLAGGAGGFQSPEEWSYTATKFLLGLSASDNGKSLSI
jgi:NAD(P)-dependent dehydrogenase (short-subunit alcohol dehydrogenase family)